MISASTFAFALVLVVGVNVVAVWTIYVRLTLAMESERFTIDSAFKNFKQRLDKCERTAPANLAELVDDLAADVRKHAEIQRRFAGRFDQYVGTRKLAPAAAQSPPVEGSCDNWTQALVDGPRSAAASCECDYCVGMRARRRAEKAAILATRPLITAGKRGE